MVEIFFSVALNKSRFNYQYIKAFRLLYLRKVY